MANGQRSSEAIWFGAIPFLMQTKILVFGKHVLKSSQRIITFNSLCVQSVLLTIDKYNDKREIETQQFLRFGCLLGSVGYFTNVLMISCW